MKRPLIGVTPDYNGNRRDFGGKEPTSFVRMRYLNAVLQSGGIPFVLPLTEKQDAARMILERVDGILLTGSGPDIPPSIYHERQKYRFPLVHPLRTNFELNLCRKALKAGKPVLGICGGTQLLNVALKGTLIQDIPSDVPLAGRHRQKEPYDATSHSVDIVPGTLLYDILKKRTIRVNSFHHQAVKEPGKHLRVNATCPDGIIEGIEFPDHPFAIGVQWHPECLVGQESSSRKIFRAFIAASLSRNGSEEFT